MAGQQHRPAGVGEGAQQAAHPADPLRVQTVGRLVEHEHGGVADERDPDAEPLAHAVGEAGDALARRIGEADGLQHLLGPGGGHAEGPGGQAQRLDARAAAVQRPRVEHHADRAARAVQLAIAAPAYQRRALVGLGEPGEDAQGRGLPRAVGSEEAGDAAGAALEAQAVDGGAGAVALAQRAHLEGRRRGGRGGHAPTLLPRRPPRQRPRDRGRATIVGPCPSAVRRSSPTAGPAGGALAPAATVTGWITPERPHVVAGRRA